MAHTAKRQRRINDELDGFEPYWNLYFNSDFSKNSKDYHDILLLFYEAMTINRDIFSSNKLSQTLVVNYLKFVSVIQKLFKSYDEESAETNTLQVQDSFRDGPEKILCTLGVVGSSILGEESVALKAFYLTTKLSVRLLNYEPVTPMKSIKANMFKKLVTVRGTVVRTSMARPFLVQTKFNCAKCNRSDVVDAVDGKYVMPTRCYSSGCKSKAFNPDRSSSGQTKTIDWQQLRIQEKITDDRSDPSRMPRTVIVELTNDLTDTVVPGDFIQCTGILKVVSVDEGRGKQKGNSMYSLYIDAISLSKVGESSSGEVGSKSTGNIGFSNTDYEFIKQAYQQPNLFKLLVQSFSPAIFGHEMVKAGLLLGIFGARSRDTRVKGSLDIRHNPHILVVGDPGLGKSQMLTNAASIAPRGVYICGSSGISKTGLTVTLVKEAGSGDFALEAGALVLSDQGSCCIDEFDKMSSNHDALLEAMEQQSVSIAKAGMVCTLPARTSVLAAANPVGGHYNKSKTVSENLKMSSALLSRFDLVFILLDRPNEEKDRHLSEHVMALHSGSSEKTKVSWSTEFSSTQAMNNEPQSLQKRLEQDIDDEPLDLIPKHLLKIFIAYARKYVNPVLSSEAKEVLQAFYLKLRRKKMMDSTPITTRQLEALIRLSEARAKAELRELVTAQDAHDVVQLMEFSMLQTSEDEFGLLDFQRSQLGSGMSKRNEIKRFVSYLMKISQERFNNVFTFEMLHNAAKEINTQFSNFRDMVESLNNQGYLLKTGNRVYKLTM